MPPKTRDGTSLICPAVSDAALLNMPPPVFGDLLRASNPGLPGIQITSKVVHEAYLLVVASRIMQHPSSFLKAQYREALQRWEEHSDWKALKQVLDDEPYLAQTNVPHSQPEYRHCVFEFNNHKFSLPLVVPQQFTSDGLLISRFISDMVASNPHERVHLSTDAIQAAVVEFAIQRFPMGGLQEQFSKQCNRRAGAMALEQYARSRRDAASQDHQSADARRRGSVEARKGLPPGITNWEFYHLEHAPDLNTVRLQIHKLLDLHATKLSHGDTALQISLPSRVEKAASLERTHIHIGDSDLHVAGLLEVELVAAYDPSFVAVFASVDLRNEAEVSLRNCKFHFGDDKVETLAVDTLEWNGSNETVYQLGSGPLQSVVNLQDSATRQQWGLLGNVINGMRRPNASDFLDSGQIKPIENAEE